MLDRERQRLETIQLKVHVLGAPSNQALHHRICSSKKVSHIVVWTCSECLLHTSCEDRNHLQIHTIEQADKVVISVSTLGDAHEPQRPLLPEDEEVIAGLHIPQRILVRTVEEERLHLGHDRGERPRRATETILVTPPRVHRLSTVSKYEEVHLMKIPRGIRIRLLFALVATGLPDTSLPVGALRHGANRTSSYHLVGSSFCLNTWGLCDGANMSIFVRGLSCFGKHCTRTTISRNMHLGVRWHGLSLTRVD
mmetsp:Transcript_18309/g.49219  ORF Transcript_18309/g.49219 Transcript_18309/m.49219 type:complete len:252 (+) Transcript_18309:1032-1787(+)